MKRASVKSWSDSKGYGFVSIDGQPDVFVHYTAIYGEGFKSLKDGEVVEVELIDGPKGPQVGKLVRNLLSAENKHL